MVFLNEWLPNPPGADSVGEFVELYNSGSTPVDLAGWRLQTESAKKFLFKKRLISAHGYLILKKAESRLSLRNTDGGLALYDARGALVDQGVFWGPAPEGQSFSRMDLRTVGGNGKAEANAAASMLHFGFTSSSPGAPNNKISAQLEAQKQPFGVRLNPPLDTWGFFGIMMGTAGLVVGLIFYATKTHEDLSQLLFGRDQEPGS